MKWKILLSPTVTEAHAPCVQTVYVSIREQVQAVEELKCISDIRV